MTLRNPLFIAFAIFISGLFAQPAYAQDATLATLGDSFEKYHNSRLQEKLFVHTDKSVYLAGETLWFKLYCVNGKDHVPLGLSSVGYVELLDGTNKPVMQSKIALAAGSGSGSFVLPASVVSGNYRLRAYTAWMQNFSADFYFTSDLTVINTLRGGIAEAAAGQPVLNVGFFPEGGTLVAGLRSRVGFRVSNRYDEGVAASGMVLDDQNDTIALFAPLKFGLGRFEFTPQPGRSYRALVRSAGGESVTTALPAAADSGYVLQLLAAGSTQVAVAVSTSMPGANGTPLYLLVHNRHRLTLALQATVQNGTVRFLIDREKLGAGISQLTVFDNRRRPVCERLYFQRPADALRIEASANAAAYAPRSKVALTVQAQAGKQPLPVGMSVSVYRIDSLTVPDEADIFSYLWLAADLRGRVEAPGYYARSTGPEADEAADNLMLIHGWRRFEWKDVLEQAPPVLRYLPEVKGPIVSARITRTPGGAPVAGVHAYLSVPGTPLQVYNAESNAGGEVVFHLKPFYGVGEVILQAHKPGDSSLRIDVRTPFSSRFSEPAVQRLRMAPNWQPVLVRRSVATQVQHAYRSADAAQFLVPKVDSLPFYGKYTKRYLLDDYTRFTTMEEVLREFVTEVGVRKKGGQFILPVVQTNAPGFYEGEPLVLLDGVPLFNNNPLMAYDPLKVRQIEVVTDRYFLGPAVHDGIISFTTYNGTLDGFELDPRAVVLDYEGLQLQRRFDAPQYATEAQVASRLPDFRSLLYWNPDVRTITGKPVQLGFYTPDVKGSYIGVVQALAADGSCGSGYLRFEVK